MKEHKKDCRCFKCTRNAFINYRPGKMFAKLPIDKLKVKV